MEISSAYDSFIKRISRINLYLIITSLSLIFLSIISVIFLVSNLLYSSIIIFSCLAVFGINYSITSNLKKKVIVDFAKLFEIDIEDDFSELKNTISMYKSGKFEQIKSSFTNKEHRRSRGFDEKGPTGGTLISPLDKNNQRIDAMKNNDFQDITEEITAGQALIREADEQYAKISEDRWKNAEAKDADLIEAGIERLGDLVKTDWFEKNAKDGAIKELYDKEDLL